jgi:hypothetical protein
VSPETIDAMLAAGVTAEVLAAAWKAEIAQQEQTAQERRARDAERQRRHRESRDVTVTNAVSTDPSPNERDILTPTREGKTEPKGSSKSLIVEEKRKAVASCLRIAFPAPVGVTDEQWSAFRKQRKKALNDRSYVLLCNKLTELADAGWPPGEMIDLAIERGWETVFAPRNFGNERTDRDPTTVALERLIGPHAGTG